MVGFDAPGKDPGKEPEKSDPKFDGERLPAKTVNAQIGPAVTEEGISSITTGIPGLPSSVFSPLARHRYVTDKVAGDMHLRGISNQQFVDIVNQDSRTPAGTEWTIGIGTGLTKAGFKGYLGKLAADATMGSANRAAPYIGMGLGIPAGVAAGAFTAYELSSIWQNTQRIDAFKERLLQPYDTESAKTTRDRDGSALAASLWQPDARGYGVTEAVNDYLLPAYDVAHDYTFGPVANYFRAKLGGSPELPAAESAEAHSDMSNARYIQWAEQNSSYSQVGQMIHDAAFGTGGYLAAMYVASHLIPQGAEFAAVAKFGAPILRTLGAGLGVVLSRVKTTADERQREADLLQARLLEKPTQQT